MTDQGKPEKTIKRKSSTRRRRKMGRPTTVTAAVMRKVLDKIATTSFGLESICKDIGVGYTTVVRALQKDAEFRGKYALAKESQADHMAEEILDIADDARNDWMTIQRGKELVEVVDKEAVMRSKLRVEARQWLMGKLARKKFGEVVEARLANQDGGPMQVLFNIPRPEGPDAPSQN